MNPGHATRIAVVLTMFAVAFIALTVSSYTRKSATWDEPQHVTAGYWMWKTGDYRLDVEHPPFIRMWAALPCLKLTDTKWNFAVIDQIAPASWAMSQQFEFCHWFLYRQNDADRLLYQARFMIVLLGVVLGVMVFAWANELFGFWPATIALGLYTLEPNILAHASVVTTDFGITCFLFGAVYLLWRWTRRQSFGNAAGFVAFVTLSVISKFTSILLVPVAVVLLGIHTYRTRAVLRSVLLLAAALLTSWLAVWAVYGFRYLPSRSPEWKYNFQSDPSAVARAPKLTLAVVSWADEHHLVPNAFAQGFLLGQIKAQQRGAYLMGKFSTQGWWYYFPVAFVIKTPVALLAVLLAGFALIAVRWRTILDHNSFLLLPVIVIFGTAMAARLNIGLRHVLPSYPFAILIGASTIQWLLSHRNRTIRAVLAAICVSAVMESALIWPDHLAFFNGLVGGARNGQKYLLDSNLDWGQDLKPLKRWMDENGVSFINLSYFGTADPAYYGINDQPLPGAPFFDATKVGQPRLPGLVAVSATNLRGVYFDEATREYFRPLWDAKPVAVIGHSIFVYAADAGKP